VAPKNFRLESKTAPAPKALSTRDELGLSRSPEALSTLQVFQHGIPLSLKQFEGVANI